MIDICYHCTGTIRSWADLAFANNERHQAMEPVHRNCRELVLSGVALGSARPSWRTREASGESLEEILLRLEELGTRKHRRGRQGTAPFYGA